MRRILQYILSVFIVLPLMAEENGRLEITNLNWNELKIDSVLPVYTEVVPLQTDFSLYNYSVVIEYPEYAPMTQKEQRKLLNLTA